MSIFKKISVASILWVIPFLVMAATDGTYNITIDNVGFAGGEEIGDGTYDLSDTIGTPLVGTGGGVNYKTQDGFWYMVNNTLELVLDSNTKDLGTVTAGSPNTASTTVTVTTDAAGGYDLLISEDDNMTSSEDGTTTIDDYTGTIDTPTAWSGVGFGFTVVSGSGVHSKWGASPNNNYAGMTTAGTIFHSKEGYTSGNDNTVVEYKVDIPGTQRSGVYTNIVTYTAISKL